VDRVCDFASWQCPVARAHPHYPRTHVLVTLQRLEIDQILPSCLPYDFAQRSSAIRGPLHRCGGAAYSPAMPSHHSASAIACGCVHIDSALGGPLAGRMFLVCRAAAVHTQRLVCMWLLLLCVGLSIAKTRASKALFCFDLDPNRRKCYTGKWVL
jgi:hypothetical protein